MKKTLFLFTVIFFLTACNNETEVPKTEAAARPAVPMMPAMNLQNEQGQIVSLSQFKGKKVFVNLWATWCPPCREEMPGIKRLAAAVDSNKVAFVMLSLDEEFAVAQNFARQTNLNLPIYGPASALPALFQTPGIPVTYIFNENGELIFRRNQADNYDQPRFVELLGGKQ